MKKYIIFSILVFVFTGALAQIKFEPGYIVNNDGQRAECEIRNMDWESNPTAFEYRIAGGETKEGTLQSVQEFGISGGVLFRRFTVDIDRSSDVVSRLSKERNPEFKSETLFLRQLTTGKAVLYEYVDAGLKRYFYSIEEKAPQQLVYKRYMQMDKSGRYESGYAAANEQYKQQILNDLACPSISQRDVEGLKYERKPLVKIFGAYNSCTGTAVATTAEVKPASQTHLALRPGLFSNGFYVDNGASRTEFEKALSFRIGAELEIVMPFNKGLWSTTFEPAYQGYSSKTSNGTVTIDYKSIDLGVSIRRYFFIKKSGSLYANLGFVYAIPISGKDAIKVGPLPLDISTGVNLTAGVGYRMGKFSAEFNYAFSRGLLGDYSAYSSGYSGPGLILGYQIF
jgi:hypothetical protein